MRAVDELLDGDGERVGSHISINRTPGDANLQGFPRSVIKLGLRHISCLRGSTCRDIGLATADYFGEHDFLRTDALCFLALDSSLDQAL